MKNIKTIISCIAIVVITIVAILLALLLLNLVTYCLRWFGIPVEIRFYPFDPVTEIFEYFNM